MQRTERRVGASIPIDMHVFLCALAEQHGTTVGALVEYGLKLAIRKLRQDSRAAARIRKDGRRKEK